MELTIVGGGYVGLVTAACLANTGHRVRCLDTDGDRIAALRDGACPIFEPGLAEILQRNRAAGRLVFTTEPAEAYVGAEAIIVCVGTPTSEEGRCDSSAITAVCRDIAAALDAEPEGPARPLVVIKSTVPMGTTHAMGELIASLTSRPFSIANNPEFLREGDAVHDFQQPDRIVCGVEDEHAETVLRRLHEPFVRPGSPILFYDSRSSEMVKYASNAMLACKISFINEIAVLCERYGADIGAVREGMSADHRIGTQFLRPGLGYGGSCFPKDTLAVIGMGRHAGVECRINAAVHTVNQAQRTRFLETIGDHFDGVLAGRAFAVWGLSFKPRTDDVREAPAVAIVRSLLASGAAVTGYDPAASATFRRAVPGVRIADDMYEALDGADALILCTEWSEFRNPDLEQVRRRLSAPVVFDGRNLWSPDRMRERGFTYRSIGRPPVLPATTAACPTA